MTDRLRFAPSPTGYLHIGGARTALFNWLWARKTRGTFILRIEDTDQERSTDASRAAIFESLRWLGLDWDEGPGEADRGAYGPYTQMQRLAIYRQHADALIRAGKAYRCYCTKAELDARRAALGGDPSAGFKYPGTCRDRRDEPDLPHVVRFKANTAGSIEYDDLVFKKVRTPNKELQDFVLLRSDGVPLYNFGAVVDDLTMDITIVARGRDHMINTPPQIQLYEALGARVPRFAHLPMMLAQNGEKLSKRHGAVSVTEYRDQGYSPDAVLDYLARFGWSQGEIESRLSRSDLIAAFDWAQCQRADGKFDPRKFRAVDHDHLRSPQLMPDASYVEHALPCLAARGLTPSADAVLAALPLVRERAQTFVDAADLLDPYFRDPPVMDAAAVKKFLTADAAPRLRVLHDACVAASDWSASTLEGHVTQSLASASLAMRDVGPPARVALTGRATSPSLFDVLALLGRDRALARLASAARVAEQA